MKINIDRIEILMRHLKALDLTIDQYKALSRLEKKAHRFAEYSCNGYTCSPNASYQAQEANRYTQEQEEKDDAKMRNAIDKVLGNNPIKNIYFLNGDPRGYALKIKDVDRVKAKDDKKFIELLRANGAYTDFGGYIIIAPEF